MQTVRDESGDRYLLVKRSSSSSLVRDPATGEERYVDNDRLEPCDDESPLSLAARAAPGAVRTVLTATRDDRSLGLLFELVDRGPLAVRTLLDEYDLCESDLHGLLTEFRAAGLVEPADVTGRRGYAATEVAREGVTAIRRPDAEERENP